MTIDQGAEPAIRDSENRAIGPDINSQTLVLRGNVYM